MRNVLSFDKWKRLNEQTTIAKTSSSSKPVAKPMSSSGSNTTMKGGSSSGKSARPTSTTIKSAPVTNYSSIAIQISDKINNLFRDTNFWAQYKGSFNDDEDGALIAFNDWWKIQITPLLSKLPSTDPNTQTIIRTQPAIQKALLGSSSSDTVSWTIRGAQGMSKTYSVNTDF